MIPLRVVMERMKNSGPRIVREAAVLCDGYLSRTTPIRSLHPIRV